MIDSITDDLPFEYVKEAKRILKLMKRDVTDNYVYSVRNLRTYDLDVAVVLKGIAEKAKSENATPKIEELAEEFGLVK